MENLFPLQLYLELFKASTTAESAQENNQHPPWSSTLLPMRDPTPFSQNFKQAPRHLFQEIEYIHKKWRNKGKYTMPQKSFCWYLRAYPHFDIILHERLIFSVLKYKIYRRQTYQERNCNYRYTKWLLLFKFLFYDQISTFPFLISCLFIQVDFS